MAALRLAALPALAALAASVPPEAGRGAWAASSTWDSEALFQDSRASLKVGAEERLEAQQELQADGWPSLADIWNDVKDTTSSITDTVGAVLGNASEEVDAMVQQGQQVAGGIAKKLADALERVLKHVKSEVDILKNETTKDKQIFISSINQTIQSAQGTVIPDVARAVNASVNKSLTLWTGIEEIVALAASTIASAFKAAGQEKLSNNLQNALDNAVQYIKKFTDKIEAANEKFQKGAKGAEKAQTGPWLQDVDNSLSEALQNIGQFILQFENAFQDLIDALSEALSFSSEDVGQAFAPVTQDITAIAWRVRSASRDAAMGLHGGLVQVAKAKNLKPPVWHRVEMPVLEGAAAAHWGQLAAAALGLLAAAAAL